MTALCPFFKRSGCVLRIWRSPGEGCRLLSFSHALPYLANPIQAHGGALRPMTKLRLTRLRPLALFMLMPVLVQMPTALSTFRHRKTNHVEFLS